MKEREINVNENQKQEKNYVNYVRNDPSRIKGRRRERVKGQKEIWKTDIGKRKNGEKKKKTRKSSEEKKDK